MINWDRVNQLREEVGADDFLEVVDLFLEEVEEVVDGLKAATEPAELEAALHFLKGSSLNLGFFTLGELCGQAEKLARDRRLDEIDISHIVSAYHQSMAEFLAGSAQRNFAA